MKISQIILFIALFSACLGASLPLKSVATNLASSAKFFMNEINKQQSDATPEVEALGGEAQSDLTATNEKLKSAADSADQTVEFPIGMSEGDAASLTSMKTVLGDLKSKVSGMSTPPQNALNDAAESSLMAADVKLKYLVEDLQSPGGIFVPKIPPAVTTDVARGAATYKAFRDIRPSKPNAPKQTNTASQAAYILAGMPPAPRADVTGAGDADTPTTNVQGSQQINQALTRLNKSLQKSNKVHRKKAKDVEVPMFRNKMANQSVEFSKLAKQMKSLESSLQRLPTMKEAQQRANQHVQARNTLLAQMDTPKVEGTAESASHISASKVKLMSDLVTSLDELGRFFGEDEMIDEDDNLAIIEDPKIALANANLAAATERIRADLKARPDRFRDHTKLSDLRHHFGHPVSITHAAPAPTDDPAGNLQYLRTLRNYVSSLREDEKRRA